jgi:hypothetical protein
MRMTPALTNSGIPLMDEVPWGSHLCVFYRTHDDLFEAAAAYFEAGLQGNEFCIWLLPKGVSQQDARSALTGAVEDAAQHIEEGRMQVMTSRSTQKVLDGEVRSSARERL